MSTLPTVEDIVAKLDAYLETYEERRIPDEIADVSVDLDAVHDDLTTVAEVLKWTDDVCDDCAELRDDASTYKADPTELAGRLKDHIARLDKLIEELGS